MATEGVKLSLVCLSAQKIKSIHKFPVPSLLVCVFEDDFSPKILAMSMPLLMDSTLHPALSATNGMGNKAGQRQGNISTLSTVPTLVIIFHCL